MNVSRAAISPSELFLPLFQDRVAAGFPSPAQDYIDKGVDLNQLCVSPPAATYFVMATGTSMIDAGIYEGSMLVVVFQDEEAFRAAQRGSVQFQLCVIRQHVGPGDDRARGNGARH